MLYNFQAKKLFVGHRVYACVYQLSLIDLNQRRFIRFVQVNSSCYRLQAHSKRNRVNLIIDEVLSHILSLILVNRLIRVNVIKCPVVNRWIC